MSAGKKTCWLDRLCWLHRENKTIVTIYIVLACTYCWWFRNPAPLEVGSFSHYLQGNLVPSQVVGNGISEPSTVPLHFQVYTVDACRLISDQNFRSFWRSEACRKKMFFSLAFLEMGVEPKIGGKPPKWMVYFMEIPRKKGWFGGKHPYFWKHPYIFVAGLMGFNWVWPPHRIPMVNEGLVRDSLLKMVHIPGGHCYRGHTQGLNGSLFCNHDCGRKSVFQVK